MVLNTRTEFEMTSKIVKQKLTSLYFKFLFLNYFPQICDDQTNPNLQNPTIWHLSTYLFILIQVFVQSIKLNQFLHEKRYVSEWLDFYIVLFPYRIWASKLLTSSFIKWCNHWNKAPKNNHCSKLLYFSCFNISPHFPSVLAK